MEDVDPEDYSWIFDDCYTEAEYNGAKEEWEPEGDITFPFYAKHMIGDKMEFVEVVDV